MIGVMVIVVAAFAHLELLGLAGFSGMLLGLLWLRVRKVQISAMTAIATKPLDACPFCNYSLSDLTDDTCPECGRHPRADTQQLRQVMGIANKPPGQ